MRSFVILAFFFYALPLLAQNEYLEKAKKSVDLTHQSARLYANALLSMDATNLLAGIAKEMQVRLGAEPLNLAQMEEALKKDIQSAFASTPSTPNGVNLDLLLDKYSDLQRKRFELSWRAPSYVYGLGIMNTAAIQLSGQMDYFCEKGRSDFSWNPNALAFAPIKDAGIDIHVGYEGNTNSTSRGAGSDHKGKVNDWYVAAGVFAAVGMAMTSSVVLAPFAAIPYALSGICTGIGADTDMHSQNDEVHRMIEASKYQFENIAVQENVKTHYREQCSALRSQIKAITDIFRLNQAGDFKQMNEPYKIGLKELPELEKRFLVVNGGLCKETLDGLITNKLCDDKKEAPCEVKDGQYIIKDKKTCSLPVDSNLRAQELAQAKSEIGNNAVIERESISLKVSRTYLLGELVTRGQSLEQYVSQVSWSSLDEQLVSLREKIFQLYLLKRKVQPASSDNLDKALVFYKEYESVKLSFHELLTASIKSIFNPRFRLEYENSLANVRARSEALFKKYPTVSKIRELVQATESLRTVMAL